MRQHEEDFKIKGADKILWDRYYCQEIASKHLHFGRDSERYVGSARVDED